MDPQEVLKILEARLSAASVRQDKASTKFNEIVAHLPSSIPYPDSVTRVQQAARAYRGAMQ